MATRTLRVTWHPNAVRRAIDNASSITKAARDADEVYDLRGGHLSFMDLACLIDAARAALGDDEAVDWERVAVKLALADGADFGIDGLQVATAVIADSLANQLDEDQLASVAAIALVRLAQQKAGA